jgi:tyrosine recombinase XerC
MVNAPCIPADDKEPNNIKLLAAIDGFALHLADVRDASAHTVKSYVHDLAQFSDWLSSESVDSDELRWEQVTYPQIRSYLGHLAQNGYNRRSVTRKLSSLKAFYKWLEREVGITDNPAAKVLSPKASRPLPDVLDVSEIERMLEQTAKITSFSIRDRALIEVLYATGMRVAEACALKLGDVDWRAGEIRVIGGKGNKDRVVLMGRFAKQALEKYVHESRPSLLARRRNKLELACENVWINARGTALSSHAVYVLVQEYAARAGITKKVTPHTMRHSFATHLLQHGADLRVVQELLGHRSLSSTQVYTRVSAAHLKGEYDKAHPRAKLEEADLYEANHGLSPTIDKK